MLTGELSPRLLTAELMCENRREIDFESGGKAYKLSDKPAVLLVRYGAPHYYPLIRLIS